MKMRRGLLWIVSLAVLLSLLFLCSSALADESYTAGTMRLLRYEGDVTILNSEGVSRFVLEDVRFDSGESMLTGEDGIASVGLDDTKIVTMDHLTEVQFIREDQHLRLNLAAGTLFLDVREALDENEGFDIQTTTMTAGIRGTVVFFSVLPAPDGSGLITRFGVLEGTADVSYTDSTGASRRIPVSAGQILTAGPENSSEAGIDPVLSGLKPEDVEGFVLNVVDSDPALQDRVTLSSDSDMLDITADLPADGDWFYSGVVTLVAQSASKLYDGLPLTRPDNSLVYGLPSGFSISVSAGGSRTDAGTSPNDITGWTIRNKAGEDVTSHFPNVKCVSGSLVVDRTPLVVWTESAEKTYDGSPLTCPDAGIRSVEGYSSVQPVWMNTSLVTESAMGSEQMFALSGHTFILGTNPLTGETETYDLPVGYSLSVLLHGEEGGQSLEFKIDPVRETDLPEEVLRLYAANPDMLALACQDAGWDPDLMAELIAALPPVAETAAVASASGLMVAPEMAENVMVDSANVRIHVDTDITNYNTRPLTEEEASFTPIVLDPSIVVTATGSQTDAGTSDNTYTIDWGNANPNNYILREELGTLTVTPADLSVTTGSASNVYDGTPLTCDDVEIAGLAPGDTITVTPTGTITDVGTADNTCTIAWDEAKEENYTLSLTPGTLTVEPLSVSVNCGGGTASYMGGLYVPSPVLTYRNGSHAGETVSAVRVTGAHARPLMFAAAAGVPSGQRGDMQFRFTLFTGDTVDVTISGLGTVPGTYTLSASVSSASSNIDMDNIPISGSALVIEPAQLEITTGSATREYDGTALTSDEVTVTGLSGEDTVTVTATGSQTEIGSSANTYTLVWSGADPDNYTVTETLGVLEVTAPAVHSESVVFTAESESKVYDGTALENITVSVSGLPSGFTYQAVVSGSQLGVGTCENTVSDIVILNENGRDVTSLFTHVQTVSGVLEVTPAPLAVSSAPAEKAYDGTPLTAGDPVITGLVSGETVSVTFKEGTDSVTVPGSVTPEFVIDWTGADSANYTLSENPGKLTVTKAPLTVSSAPADKPYDGTPLTAGEPEITGLVAGDTISVAYQEGTDSITTPGSVTPVFVISWGSTDSGNYELTESPGTLTVSRNATSVRIVLENLSKVYDGTPLQGYSADSSSEGLDDALFWAIGSGDASLTDAGSVENPIVDFMIGLRSTEEDVTAYFSNITLISGQLVVNPAPVSVSTPDDSKVYDGSPLPTTTDQPFITGLISPDSATITMTGSQTDVGSSPNTYAIIWGDGTNQNNYTVTDEDLGTLRVDPRPVTVTITGHTGTVVYDGSEHQVEGYDVAFADDLYDASYITFSGTAVAKGTDADDYAMGLDSSQFTNTNGNFDVTFVVSDGSLSITPATLTVQTGSASKTYDGTPLTASSASLSGLKGSDTASVTATGSATHVADSGANTYVISWGTAKAGNYTVSENLGTLTVSPAPLTVTTGSGSRTYNGIPLTNPVAYLSGLQNSEAAGVNALGSATHVRDSGPNTYQIYWGTAVSSDYTVIENLGTLTITPATLTVTTGSAEKVYDGSPLTASSATLTGLNNGETATVTATGSVTHVADSGTNTYQISWGTAVESDYAVSESLGTLTVSPAELTVTTGSAEKVYDCTPLTASEASISGLQNGETASVTATGSVTYVPDSGKNTYEISWGTARPADYIIVENLGTLNVKYLHFTVTSVKHTSTGTFELRVTNCDIPYSSLESTGENSWVITWSWGDTVSVTVDQYGNPSVRHNNSFSVYFGANEVEI